MPYARSSLLTRLRRHRGLWVLAVAVLLIKLVAGTVCLADAPEKRLVSTTTISAASMPMDAVVADVSADDANACLLGETGGCHCACAHAAPLTGLSASNAAALNGDFESPTISSGYQPASPGSLLRPPIA